MRIAGNLQAPLSSTPLGAGDLIDRAVRFYRKNFWTFVLIASPPVIVGTVISVAWTVAGREIFNPGMDPMSIETTFYYLFAWVGTLVIWVAETIGTLVVMGGASRNFVRHLLFGEAITFSETYRNIAGRIPGLLAAATIITLTLTLVGGFILNLGMVAIFLAVAIIVGIFGSLPALAFVLSIAVGITIAGGTLWVFFFVAARLAYVPQVMLVEGQGVGAAMSRSASLAGSSVKRLGSLFVFTTVAAYSALALLYVPLAWYASANGVPLLSFDADLIPAWYEIAYNLIWQVSFILLSPVWMVGLSLLYVDERVRSEGYDLELMAAARLGDIPSVPESYVNPLHPAIAKSGVTASAPAGAGKKSDFVSLGLK
ncbi:MAG: hypothetical protein WKF34_13420 [Pyrinomonadaceae bacterium]